MKRVVVCPYCRRALPEPLQRGLAYACACSARFAIFEENDLEDGLARLVSDLFAESPRPLTDLLEHCQVTIFRNYPAETELMRPSRLSEFVRGVRFEPAEEPRLDLIWVARRDSLFEANPLDQIKD